MTAPPNIEVFNQVAARTFVMLYEAFPAPRNLEPALIGLDVVLSEKYPPDGTHHEALVSSVWSAIQYLIDESYIRLDPNSRDLSVAGYAGAVLTSKGFALLQKTPESVDPNVDRRSFFDRLKDVTTSGVKASAPEAVGAIIARLLGAG